MFDGARLRLPLPRRLERGRVRHQCGGTCFIFIFTGDAWRKPEPAPEPRG